MHTPHPLAHFWQGKTILITGGAGFVGHHLTTAFAQAGARVIVYDNFSTGNYERMVHIMQQHPQVTCVRGCITRLPDLTQHYPQVDHLVHLAAASSVTQGQQDPDGCFQSNVHGTYEVLRAARLWGCSVTFASSAAVYGPQQIPCQETMPANPQSWYARSKYMGEIICQQAATMGVATLCLRYFNVIGSGQAYTGPQAGVASIWRHQIARQEPIIIQGDGQQVRDFVPVEQIVQAHMRLPLMPYREQRGQPINICTGKGLSLHDLVQQLAHEQGLADYRVTYSAPRPDDIQVSIGDCSLYQKMVCSLSL